MIINNDENIISLNTTLKSHVYAIKDSLGYTLIDTSFPGKGKAIIKELKRIKINLKQINKILITHSDIDHIGSAKYLMKKLKCKVYISQAEYDNYLTKSQKIIDELPWFKKFIIKNFLLVNRDHLTIIRDHKIDEFEVITTPPHFHSYGMVMYLYKQMLFCGDFIQSKCNKFMLIPENHNLDNKIYLDFIKKFDMSNINYVCQSHGKPLPAHPLWAEFIKTL